MFKEYLWGWKYICYICFYPRFVSTIFPTPILQCSVICKFDLIKSHSSCLVQASFHHYTSKPCSLAHYIPCILHCSVYYLDIKLENCRQEQFSCYTLFILKDYYYYYIEYNKIIIKYKHILLLLLLMIITHALREGSSGQSS